MIDIGLYELGDPPVLVAGASAQVLLASALPPSGSMVVARLDGARMAEAHDVFEQFSDAFKFPAYFGWNWNALSDCLFDLSWRPADCYLIVIDQAEEILKEYPEDRKILFAVLSRATREWANPLGRTDGRGIPFTVLLMTTDDGVEGVRAETVQR